MDLGRQRQYAGYSLWRRRASEAARQPTHSTVFILIIVALLVTTCGPSPTPTSVPTGTPPPSATPIPTAAPSPTSPIEPAVAFAQEGDALFTASDFSRAEAAFRKAIQADPAYQPAHIGLVWACIWQTGREREALALAEKAVEVAPDNAVAHAALAQAYLDLMAIGEAVEAAQRAAELDGDHPQVQATLSQAYLLDRRDDAARQAAEKAIALDPQLAEAYFALSLVYGATADYSRSRAALERAVALQPQFAPWYSALGRTYDLMDEHEKATAFYDRALELDADNVSTILGQAAVAIDEREYDEAEALIQRALELVPDAPQPYAQYGDLCLERDEVDEARAHFREALSREENYWPALVGICEVHLHEQECEGAARQAQDLMALQPRLGDGRVYMGFARLCSGDINKALEYFRKAQELEPHSPSAYAGLGLAYAFQGRWEESLSAYVEALRLSPARAPMHCYLADSFMGQAEVEWAKAELRTALNLDPDLLEAHGGLAEILLSEGNAVEASAQAEEALALDEDHPYAMRLLGMALFAQDSPDEAAKVLEDLLANEPEDALGHFFLGLAYRDLARYADAKKHLETNLALDPSGDVAAMSQSLVLALDRGYVLTEDKAISDITEVLAMVLDADTDVHVEDVELEGRTLVISFAADPESQQEELLADLSSAMSVAALFAPRIDPAIENAVDVYVDVDGKPTYKLRMSAEAAKKFADGVLAPGEVASELQFSRTIAGTTEATIEKVEKDLAETRELEARAEVPYHAMTREDLQQYLTERTDAQAREAMRSSDLLLTLLGVIGPEDDLEQMLRDLDVGQVAGFYDSDEKHFYVLEDQEQTALEQMTVAHEYVHALQDQHFDLEELDSKALDGDGRRAFDALVEGDAVLAMVLYGDEHVEYVDLLQAMCSAGGLGSEALEASPAFIREMELFPYDRGVEFVLALFQSGGWEAVNQAYDNPPQSTEQVLHPERYREEDEPQEVSLPDLAEELGGDWRTLDCEVMGELGLRLVLAQHVAPAAAMLAAEGWAGDRYALLQKGADGPLVLVMRTVWDDRDEADQFWALYDLYARHRAGYTEDVTELVGKVSTRWWQSDHGWAFAEQEDRYVTAILGPDKQTISDVLDALHGS